MAAAIWPLVEQVRWVGHVIAMLLAATRPIIDPCMHLQVAEHYNLSIISPAPSRCLHDDCWDYNPFVWCEELSHG